jgi:gas vesicle structural protein
MSYRDDVDYLEPKQGETLLDVLDMLLDSGVVISGDLQISVAGVDLLYVGLKLLASSVDTAEHYRLASARRAA